MEQEAVITASPGAENPYLATFKRYITKKIQMVLAGVRQATPALPPSLLKQALHVLDYALDLPEAWPETRALLLAMAPKMEQAGFRDEWLPYVEEGVRRSRDWDDRAAEAELRLELGLLYQWRSKYDRAQLHLEASAGGFDRLNRPDRRACALNRLAYVARLRRQFEKAAGLVEAAQQLLEPDDQEWAFSYYVSGLIALDRRVWPEAVRFSEKAFALGEKTRQRRLMGRSLICLGAALRPQEKYEEAIAVYERAIALFEETQDFIYQAVTEMNLGNVYLMQARPFEALKRYLAAEKIFCRVQDRLHLAHVYHNLGLTYRRLERWDKARKAYLSSFNYWRQVGNIERQLNAMDGLGLVYVETGQLEKAEATFKRALKRLARIKDGPGYDHWRETLTAHWRRLEEGRD